MIAKKNPRYDLERKRFAFFQTGLLTIGALTLAAFAWESPVVKRTSEKPPKKVVATSIEYRQEKKDPIVVQKKEVIKKEQESVIQLASVVTELSSTIKSSSTSEVAQVSVVTPFKTGSMTSYPKLGLPDIDIEKIHDISDVEATYIGGYHALTLFVQKEINYPQICIEGNIQGKVYVGFVIEKDGSVSHVKILRGVDEDLDREAIRLVRAMPKWKPGENGGKKVRTRASLPVNFVLN